MLIKLNKKITREVKQKNEQGEFETIQQECNEIEFDFEGLTGKDLIAANKEAIKIEGPSFSPTLSMAYQAAVAARAAKVPIDVIMNAEASDFTTITIMTQDFLLRMGSKR